MKSSHMVLCFILAVALVLGIWAVVGFVLQCGLAAFGITFTLYQCIWIIVGVSILCSILKGIFGGNK